MFIIDAENKTVQLPQIKEKHFATDFLNIIEAFEILAGELSESLESLLGENVPVAVVTKHENNNSNTFLSITDFYGTDFEFLVMVSNRKECRINVENIVVNILGLHEIPE